MVFIRVSGNNPKKSCCIVHKANNWFDSEAPSVGVAVSLILENSRAATTNSSPWPKCILKTRICLNSAHLPHRTPAISTFYCAAKLLW